MIVSTWLKYVREHLSSWPTQRACYISCSSSTPSQSPVTSWRHHRSQLCLQHQQQIQQLINKSHLSQSLLVNWNTHMFHYSTRNRHYINLVIISIINLCSHLCILSTFSQRQLKFQNQKWLNLYSNNYYLKFMSTVFLSAVTPGWVMYPKSQPLRITATGPKGLNLRFSHILPR